MWRRRGTAGRAAVRAAIRVEAVGMAVVAGVAVVMAVAEVAVKREAGKDRAAVSRSNTQP